METKIIEAAKQLTEELIDIHGEEIVKAYQRSESGKLSIGFNVKFTRIDGKDVDVKVTIKAVKDRIADSAGKVVSNQEALPL